MNKIKLLFVIFVGMFCFCYFILYNNIFSSFVGGDSILFLEGHLSIKTSSAHFGIYIDYLIGFLFNINLKDFRTFFIIFGG